MLYQVHLAWTGFELTTLVVIGTDCKGSCKSNFHTITITTHPCPKVHTLFCHDQHITDSQLFFVVFFRKWKRLNVLQMTCRLQILPLSVTKILMIRESSKYNVIKLVNTCSRVRLWSSTMLHSGSKFYWWRKPEYPEKTIDQVVSHWQTWSYNVASSTPCLNGVRTHNVSGDRHWLHG